MRVSKEAKALSNEKIIKQAARLFREKGISGTSVSDIMDAAGLTHGGFYRHFKSKDDLAVAVINHIFDGLITVLRQDIASKGASQALTLYIDKYLSVAHMKNTGQGCPVVALGVEAGRSSAAYGMAMVHGEEQMIELLAAGLSEKTQKSDSAYQEATSLFALLVGTLVMARSSHNETIIAVGRAQVRAHYGV